MMNSRFPSIMERPVELPLTDPQVLIVRKINDLVDRSWISNANNSMLAIKIEVLLEVLEDLGMGPTFRAEITRHWRSRWSYYHREGGRAKYIELRK